MPKWIIIITSFFLGILFQTSFGIAACEVDNLGQGYWKVIASGPQAECIIPGPPHPDSPFLHENPDAGPYTDGAFRISGKYKIVTSLSGYGWSWTVPAECPKRQCIPGPAENACLRYNNYYKQYDPPPVTYNWENGVCIADFGNNTFNYACFSNINAVSQVLEWVCNDQCPNDPAKTEPGMCGCGKPDTDSYGDGVPDCTADTNKGPPEECP